MTDNIETKGQLDAVERSLTATDNGKTWGVVATMSQEYATDIDDLWSACTTPDRLARWLMPITGDLKAGGRFQLEGNAGGKIETCDAPHEFTSSWEFEDRKTHIRVWLTKLGNDRTRLTLVHTGDIDSYRWAQFGPGATGVGWDCMLLGLALYISSGAALAAEAEAWELSDEAKQFFADSSRKWGDLAVDSGIPEDDARAAQQRTTEFYQTGVEQPA